MGAFTEDEAWSYGKFYDRHDLSDGEAMLFIELMEEGTKYQTCEKTILEARARTAEKAAAKAARAEVDAHFTRRYQGPWPPPHLVRVSPEMRNFLHLKDEPIRRDYVTDRIREYCRTKNPAGATHRRQIKADAPLQKLLKIHGLTELPLSDIGKRITAHCRPHTTAVERLMCAIQERQLKKKLAKYDAKQKHMKHAKYDAVEDAKKRKQTRVAFWAAAADNAQKRKHKALQVSHDLMVDTVEAPESEPAIKPSVIKPNKAIMLPEPRWRRHPVPSSQGHVPEIKSPIPELKYHGWF